MHCLVTVSKLMQHVANGMEFQPREAYLNRLNHFVATHKQALEDLIGTPSIALLLLLFLSLKLSTCRGPEQSERPSLAKTSFALRSSISWLNFGSRRKRVRRGEANLGCRLQ